MGGLFSKTTCINRILITFVNHPDIRIIGQTQNITAKFLFLSVSVNDVKQVIKCVKCNKSMWRYTKKYLERIGFTFTMLAVCIIESFEMARFRIEQSIYYYNTQKTILVKRRVTTTKLKYFRFSLRVSGKFPPIKFPPGKFPPGKFPPIKLSPEKFPPEKFPPMFLNIPTQVFNFFVFFFIATAIIDIT